MRILFCNIGWMEKYQGINSSDQISGGGAYVKEEGTGHEVCNFLSADNWVYGYVQPVNNRSIDLTRIDKKANTDFLNDVLVIWTATRPKKLGGGTTVVGWYKNATVYHEFQHFVSCPIDHQKNEISRYLIKALEENVTLLPIDARTLDIPRANKVQGGIGQSNIWYADKEENQLYVKEALSFITNYESPILNRSDKPNPEKKVLVEKAAIQTCRAYFEKLGYQIESVEKDNVGWDLVASTDKSCLRIEVKGLSGSVFVVELTPNEYKAFEEQKNDYRLAVVTNALEKPTLSICRYSEEKQSWLVESENEPDRFLDIKTKQSATLSCS